jgi:hypothetical protein
VIIRDQPRSIGVPCYILSSYFLPFCDTPREALSEAGPVSIYLTNHINVLIYHHHQHHSSRKCTLTTFTSPSHAASHTQTTQIAAAACPSDALCSSGSCPSRRAVRLPGRFRSSGTFCLYEACDSSFQAGYLSLGAGPSQHHEAL